MLRSKASPHQAGAAGTLHTAQALSTGPGPGLGGAFSPWDSPHGNSASVCLGLGPDDSLFERREFCFCHPEARATKLEKWLMLELKHRKYKISLPHSVAARERKKCIKNDGAAERPRKPTWRGF